jgi:hypothetical protein
MPKSSRKQAVLVIHGIGEQRPMETLRTFVDAVWTTNTRIHAKHQEGAAVWSKPYRLAQNFELRRLTTPQNVAGVRTDFFELYWAHLMQGTKAAHVVAWARALLLRNPGNVPKHLRLAYTVLVLLIAFGVYMGYRSAAAQAAGASALPVWASFALSLAVIPAVAAILLNIVGDAARYLHVAPANVQCRHEIRAAGVEVLKSLHEQKYERIIVVGHSLGSVIGYDILYHAWGLYNADPPVSNLPSFAALEALETLAIAAADMEQMWSRGDGVEGAAVATLTEQIHEAQRRYFNELKANGSRWRVTDFVSLGSPLAHAEILLARHASELAPKFEGREFPRCLPMLEVTRRKSGDIRRFSYPADESERVPHHAAVFAPTRWTNIYFPNRLLIRGDLIGGPLRSIFGAGVKDIAVHTSLRFGYLSHTLYWRGDKKGANAHVEALCDALDLADKNSQVEATHT